MRYTKQWHDWFKQLLDEKEIKYEFIYGQTKNTCGTTYDKIGTGEVLDVYETNIWKLTQLAELIHRMEVGCVKDGDRIFTFDMWHTGLEAIQYVKSMTGLKVDVYGIWHAGSYDHSDFTYRHGFEPWAFKLEQVWSLIAKKMFVGSKYHQQMIKDMRGIDTIVTGLPIDVERIRKSVQYKQPKKQVVITSRLDPEKRIDLAKMIEKEVHKKDSTIEFLYTHEHKFSKKEYYSKLQESSIVLSTAEHENFGIGVIEAMCFDCMPVVPMGLSYNDYVPQKYMYRKSEEAVKLIVDNMKLVETTKFNYVQFITKYSKSFDNMLREMGYGN